METPHAFNHRMNLQETTGAVETHIRNGNGVHTIEVTIGGQNRVLIVDTGSGDTALPCNTCTHCGMEHDNPFFVRTSHTLDVTCQENDAAGFLKCRSCGNYDDVCTYGAGYVEGSKWTARKISEFMSFGDSDDLKARVVLGCIYEEYGAFYSQSADGIFGMSRSEDSILSQLYSEGAIHANMFSQCISETGGSMVLGGVDMNLNIDDFMQYTPIRENGYTYWSVSMTGLSVGGAPALDVGSSVYNAGRGCVLDSGTTYIYLPTAAENKFYAAWTSSVADTHPMHHYKIDSSYTLTLIQLRELPEICFYFIGETSLCIDASHYLERTSMQHYKPVLQFLDFAHATIIGAAALKDHNILYDEDNGRIGIAKANCEKFSAINLETNVGGPSFKSIEPTNWTNITFAAIICISIVAVYITNRDTDDASRERLAWTEDKKERLLTTEYRGLDIDES